MLVQPIYVRDKQRRSDFIIILIRFFVLVIVEPDGSSFLKVVTRVPTSPRLKLFNPPT